MPIPPEIKELINRLNLELDETERDVTEGVNLLGPIMAQFPNNASLIQFKRSLDLLTMKQLPDEQTLTELISLGKSLEEQARKVYLMAEGFAQKYEHQIKQLKQTDEAQPQTSSTKEK